MYNQLMVLATQKTASTEITTFLGSGVGRFIQAILVVVGFIVVIFSLVKVVTKGMQGNVTGALKSFFIGLFLAALFFNLAFIGTFIDWASALWEGVGNTGSTVVSSAKK